MPKTSALLALAFILAACAAPPQEAPRTAVRGPIPGEVTMYFSRDDARGRACLEYSWVPTGQRHAIILAPGVQSASQPLAYTGVSQVQIYKLVNNGLGYDGEAQFWQFPPGPPYAAPPSEAFVAVLMRTRQAVGLERYADQTASAPDERPLTAPPPAVCPSPGVH